MSRIRNLTFSEGEHWIIECTFTGSDGDALNLTGASISWTVALRPGSAAIFSATTANGMITVTSATAGTAEIAVAPAAHSSATPGNWRHECRVLLSNGEYSVQFEGRLTVKDSLHVV